MLLRELRAELIVFTENSVKLRRDDRHLLNASLFQVTQHEVISRDDTRIPYRMIASRNYSRDGANPTLSPEYLGLEAALIKQRELAQQRAPQRRERVNNLPSLGLG